jgi:alkanesulfonate monooxygenase SsuD/methylene tetrahydromethanopterin reductase-like flavin-dependent oxidoreductase (luciferase family)
MPSGPPILLAANGPKSLQIAAEHATIWNTYGAPGGSTLDTIAEANATLDQHCQSLGRDPSSLRRSLLLGVAGDTDWGSGAEFSELVRRCVDVGINDFIYYAPPSNSVVRRGMSTSDATAVDGLVEQIATEVIAELRRELT